MGTNLEQFTANIQAALKPRPITVTLDLNDLHKYIAGSVKAVLEAHNFGIVREADSQYCIDDRRKAALLNEIGRNVAFVITCVGMRDEEAA